MFEHSSQNSLAVTDSPRINASLVIEEKYRGDMIDLGGLKIIVYEVPRHTRDILAFYIPERRAIFPAEGRGVPNESYPYRVQPEFLSSYQDYLKTEQTRDRSDGCSWRSSCGR